MILINLNVQVIEGVLGEVNGQRLEEAYQKKCGVLCELNEVFGKIAKRKQANILVTRVWLNPSEAPNDIDQTAKALKKLITINKIETIKDLSEMHREITSKNNDIQIELAGIKQYVKNMSNENPQTPAKKAGSSNQDTTIDNGRSRNITVKSVAQTNNKGGYRTSDVDEMSAGQYLSER